MTPLGAWPSWTSSVGVDWSGPGVDWKVVHSEIPCSTGQVGRFPLERESGPPSLSIDLPSVPVLVGASFSVPLSLSAQTGPLGPLRLRIAEIRSSAAGLGEDHIPVHSQSTRGYWSTPRQVGRGWVAVYLNPGRLLLPLETSPYPPPASAAAPVMGRSVSSGLQGEVEVDVMMNILYHLHPQLQLIVYRQP
jgi:hypothetical protein